MTLLSRMHSLPQQWPLQCSTDHCNIQYSSCNGTPSSANPAGFQQIPAGSTEAVRLRGSPRAHFTRERPPPPHPKGGTIGMRLMLRADATDWLQLQLGLDMWNSLPIETQDELVRRWYPSPAGKVAVAARGMHW